MPTLGGRKFFFGTNADLAPGFRRIDQAQLVEYLLDEMRDDKQFIVRRTLGELQQPLDPSRGAVELFRFVSGELLRGFTRVRHYWLGPEAEKGFRAGQRLVPIGIRSPREYDLTDPTAEREEER